MSKYLSLLALLLIIFSCGNGVNSKQTKVLKNDSTSCVSIKDGIIHLDLKKSSLYVKELNFKDLCDTAIYVPLETDKKCIINKISRYSKDGNDIFISSNLSLYHFDISGKFINQYGKRGRGPGEYCCGNFFIDKKNKFVYAKGIYNHKVFKFNYLGQLIKSFPCEMSNVKAVFLPSSGHIISQSSYFTPSKWCKSPKFNIIEEYDEEGKLVNSIKSNYFPKGANLKLRKGPSMCLNFNNIYILNSSQIMVQEFSNDTLFEYKNKKLIPRIITNNKEFRKRFRVDNSCKKLGINNLLSNEYSSVLSESSRYIFFRCFNTALFSIYDKKLNKLIRCRLVSKDYDNINKVPIGEVYDGNYLISFVSSDKFIEASEKASSSMDKNMELFSKRIQSISKNLTDESNPVLLIYRLRK
ncbi:MAG: 6-bladed beta-propeller [Marinifilaceae bacterium]|jgi:hypothetical protein|nr:6-bladed beta-propeller [Marinifilaceae bacterium]